MNIIIDPDRVEQLRQKHTVLELDTIRLLPENKLITAWAVVGEISIAQLPLMENRKLLHQNLLREYRLKNWNYCDQALEFLQGFWNGELDSFYQDLAQRITQYKQQDPGDAWDGVIEKHSDKQ